MPKIEKLCLRIYLSIYHYLQVMVMVTSLFQKAKMLVIINQITTLTSVVMLIWTGVNSELNYIEMSW